MPDCDYNSIKIYYNSFVSICSFHRLLVVSMNQTQGREFPLGSLLAGRSRPQILTAYSHEIVYGELSFLKGSN